ncbi:hypothetical protein [Streptomyces hydrogenans]|uniref:hypothetical protein n=1 Tax=Streptomyces hydrogenans TaxID=1873719 RepID=UPI0035DB1341
MHIPLLVDTRAASVATGARPGTIRIWLYRGHLTHHGHDRAGRALVDLRELENHLADKAA